jgi:hypothetical protein
MDYLSVAPVVMGVGWTIAYYGIVYRGVRDKSFGMPLIPLALNLAWEFFHSVVFTEGATDVESVITFVWLAVDVCITATFVIYGYRHYQAIFRVSRITFYVLTVFVFVSAFLIMGTGIPFFADFTTYFRGSLAQSAIFIAYVQNLVIAAGFIGMLWLRRSSEGQSLWIAISKMIGTGVVGIPYAVIDHPDNWYFMGVVNGLTLVLDFAYCVMICRQLQQEGRNPLTRM